MILKQELLQKFSDFSSFIITTHKNCDGDGLGAGLALYLALKKKGKQVDFFTLEEPSSAYHFLNTETIIRVFDKNQLKAKKDTLLVVVDTNDSRFIEPLYSHFNAETVFIDHHPLSKNNNKKDRKETYFIDTKASSTGEIIFSVLKNYNVKFNEEIATALYASIIFDTKMFRSIKNSPVPFKIAAELIPYISDVSKIYNSIFKNLSVNTIGVYSQLANVEYHFNNTFALLFLSQEVIKKYNTSIGEACELLDLITNVKSIKTAALIFENKDDFKLSFRGVKHDILPIARKFNGGGHHFSGGSIVKKIDLKEMKAQIISAFSDLLEVKKVS